MVNKTLVCALCMALCLCFPQLSIAASNTKGSIQALGSTKISDPKFSENMHSLQKKLYKLKKWDYFFGLTSFLNTHEINFDVKSEEKRVSLEMLALAKHCRFNDALLVAKHYIKEPLINRAIITKATKVVKLQREYELQRLKLKNIKGTLLLVKKRLHWPLNNKQLGEMSHPKNIRKVVKSKCII